MNAADYCLYIHQAAHHCFLQEGKGGLTVTAALRPLSTDTVRVNLNTG